MKVAEIGAETGKRVGRSVGESVSSRSTSGNHRLGSPRATVYRRRGLQRQIISAELSRPSPLPNTNSIITRLNEPKRAKNKRGRWRKWRRRSSYLHTPSVTVRCWICLMALRIAHFSVAQGAEEHCEAELWLKREIWVANSDFARFGRGGFHTVGYYQCYICAGREKMLKSKLS